MHVCQCTYTVCICWYLVFIETRGVRSSGTRIQMVVGYYVGARNQLRNHPLSPPNLLFGTDTKWTLLNQKTAWGLMGLLSS